MKLFYRISFLFFVGGTIVLPAQDSQTLLRKTYNAIEQIKVMELQLVSEERIKPNQYSKNIMDIKIESAPLKIQVTMIEPFEGAILEYDESIDRYKAKITPPSWWLSWAKITLNINGKMLRKDMHHSIRESGFNYFGNIMKNAEIRAISVGYDRVFKIEKQTIVNGQSCYQLRINDPTYEILSYTVKEGEDVLKIAKNRYISEYKIIELNPKVKHLTDVKAGQILKIPSSYATSCLIWIDSTSFLPKKIEAYDEVGLFERYTFKNIIVHP